MEFCAAPGSAFVAWADAIRGEAAGPTQFRPIQIILFVNSPAGNDYGSPSMDCHNRLRHRADLVVRLHRFAFTSTSAGAGGRISHAGDD